MYLLNVCQNPDILRIIFFVKKILDIAFIIIPIGLIIFLIIDIYKMVISGEEKTIKQNQKMIINRIVFAILIFFVPTIVSFTMNLLNNVGFNVEYMDCLYNANKEDIERLTKEVAEEAIKTAKQEMTYQSIQNAKQKIDKIKDKDKKENLQEQLKVLEEQYKQSNQNKDDDDKNNNTGNKYDNDDDHSDSEDNIDNNDTQSTTEFENYGSNGIEGMYFAPIQQKLTSFGSYGNTSGCDNSNVSHDTKGVKEGTKIYAGMDGTAEFYQRYCSTNKELYSYGNMVKITATDGTYIIYAHLKTYPDNVLKNSTNSNIIKKTCPPKSDGSEPCPYNSCSGTIQSNVIAKMQVKKGDLIGYVGNTGNSTGAHLHVEIHPNGNDSCTQNPWKSFGY